MLDTLLLIKNEIPYPEADHRDQVQSGVIKRIYNLLIAQPKVHREAYELNKQPVRWINFKNGYYDPVTGEMLEHNPN